MSGRKGDSETEAEQTRGLLEFAWRCAYITELDRDELDNTYDTILGQPVRMIDNPGQWTIHWVLERGTLNRMNPDTARDRPVASSPPHPFSPTSVLLIFIDGIGIGTRGEHNPLDGLESELFSIFQGETPQLPFDGVMAETDARLGVDGLPQSATGQTAILTGINASQLIGRHLNGYPSPRLKQALAEHSVYKKLMARGRSVTFANAYTRSYIDNPPRFVSATTVAAQTAGVRLRVLEDLQDGNAVSHDFTNRFLIERGFDVDTCTPEAAGARLASLAASHDFTLYEHFITDRIGHARRRDLAQSHLLDLTRFIRAVLETADLSRQTVVLTSDHGNIEDLSTRSHTLNPVATLAFGAAREQIAWRVRSLTDITPAIVEALASQQPPANDRT